MRKFVLYIKLDRQKAARLGINIADAGNVIQTALAGSALSTFYEGDRRYDVTVRLNLPFRDAVDDIANLQVPLPGAAGASGPPATVSLSEIATIDIKQGASRIWPTTSFRVCRCASGCSRCPSACAITSSATRRF